MIVQLLDAIQYRQDAMPEFEVAVRVIFDSGRNAMIPLGKLDPVLTREAGNIAGCTPGCACPACDFNIRVALGLRYYWARMTNDQAQAFWDEEATDANLARALRAMKARYQAEYTKYKESGKLMPGKSIPALTEGDRTQNMPVETPKKPVAAKTAEKPAFEKKFTDVQVARTGDKIILPDGMSYEEGREWLTLREVEEEQVVYINENINVFPLEGAYAFAKALDKKFGFYAKVSTPHWWGESYPTLLGLETDFGKTEQVPWGRIRLPTLDGYLETAITMSADGIRPIFCIKGEVKQKHKALVMEIAELTRQIANEESIYKGKAFAMHFPNEDENEHWTPTTAPRFMDLSQVNADELIFPKETEDLVQYGVFTPIRKTQVCRDNKIPLKRGILLEGPPGCGKTLTAGVVAKECLKFGWTYIYIDNVKDLAQAIHFARQYQPAVIFGEDIDREVSGERDEDIDEVLNTLDGVDTKNSELMVILTTNHVERITTEAIRPGRLDMVISVKQPDSPAVERLVRLYARGLLNPSANLHEVGKALQGQIPAVIREVVERSKLASLARMNDGDPLSIEPKDLIIAAEGMIAHLALLNRKPTTDKDSITQLGNALSEAAVTAVKAALAEHKPTNGNGNKHATASA
jgi:hypothetical protein